MGSQRECTWILGLHGYRVDRLEWATARPIRSSKDLARFLQPQPLHSKR